MPIVDLLTLVDTQCITTNAGWLVATPLLFQSLPTRTETETPTEFR